MNLDLPSMEELDDIQIHLFFLDHKVQIGAQLRLDLHKKLIKFLKTHHDCFAWLQTNIIGIDPKLMVH